MGKQTIRMRDTKKTSGKTSLDQIRKALGPKCACYVLITCTEPSEKGNMEVELHFEGDESLAAFLVENASQVFDEQISMRETQ